MKNVMSIIIASLLLVASCSKDDNNGDSTDPFEDLNLPEEHFNYSNIDLPAHYENNDFPVLAEFQHAATDQDNTPVNNQITDAGATLGRVLFYDKKLSANQTISCSSCHLQEHGFSDTETLSVGFDGGLTGRHSMALVNARFYESGKFFWDERAATLEEQVLMPFQDEVEMGLTLEELEGIVQSQAYYPPLFEDAFGNESITSDKISRALAQFIRSIVNTDSKYDQARSEVQSPVANFPSFTEQENMGKNLFFSPQPLDNGNNANCAGCHVSEAFIGPIPNNPNGPTTDATTNGLDGASVDDLGIFETTGNMNDIGKFKVPSLVNIAIRPPYMHDGRFATLDEVMEHYSTGIQNHPSLIPPLVNDNGEVGNFNFTTEEKNAIIAFLNTLTDETLRTDEKYSDPFR